MSSPQKSRRGVVFSSALQVVVRATGLVAGALVAAFQARGLEKADFGVISLVLVLTGLASGLLDLGMANVTVRHISQSPSAKPQYISALVMARAGLGVVLGGVCFVVGAGLNGWQPGPTVFLFLFLTSVPLSALTAPQTILQASLRAGTQSALLLLQSLLWLACVVAASVLGAPLWVYGATFLGSSLVVGVVTWYTTGAHKVFDPSLGRRSVIPLLRESIPLGVGGIAVTAYYRIGGLILFGVAGAVASASYGAAFRLIDALQVVPGTIQFIFLPLLAGAIGAGEDRFAGRLWDVSSRVMMTVAVVTAATMSSLAESITTLLYGDSYADAAGLLRITAFAFVPICLGWLATGVVIAAKLTRPYAVVTWSSAVLSIGAALILVPQFGAEATAWITLGTELIVSASLVVLSARSTSLTLPPSTLVKLVIVLASAYGLGHYLAGLPIWISCWPVAALGTGVAVALRLIRVSDFRMILSRRNLPAWVA